MRLVRPSFALPLLLVTAAACGAPTTSTGTTPRASGAGALSNAAGASQDPASLEARVRHLEEELAKYREALAFLGKVYDQQKAQQAAQARGEHDPDAMFAVDISRDIAAGKIDGPAKAPVTIVSVFDFACPYCHRIAPVIEEIVHESKGKVRAVYMDMVVHPEAALAAHHAACAAAKQGKYKQFKAAVWEKGFVPYAESRDLAKLGEANLLAIAKTLRLDTKQLAADMHGAFCRQLVKDDMAELAKFNVDGTPTLFINGKYVGGALPKEALQQLVDEQRKIADASGAGADYYDKVVLVKGEKAFKSAAD